MRCKTTFSNSLEMVQIKEMGLLDPQDERGFPGLSKGIIYTVDIPRGIYPFSRMRVKSLVSGPYSAGRFL